MCDELIAKGVERPKRGEDYSGPQKVDHSGHLHLLRLFPSQPCPIDLARGLVIERGMGTLLIIEPEVGPQARL